jgi:hypothetical protein
MTKAKRITKIAPEQAARFGEWAENWIAIGLSTERADFDAATEAALKAYKLCNLDKPMVVLRMGSPYGATLGGALAWAMLRQLPQVGSQVESQVRSQVGSQVGSQVRSQVRSQVESQVRSQVGSQVWSQVRSQVRSQVWSQVGSQVESQVRSQVGSQVGSQVWSQVRSQVESQVWSQVGSQVWSAVNNDRGGAFWASWCAYVSFIRDVLGWRDPVLERFDIDEALLKSCGWVWWHENVLAISDRPTSIHRDANGRLHSETGPAITYPDGWGLSCWHGVTVPGEWLTGAKPSASEALQWSNVEQRRAACEILGWGSILSELNAKVIDKHDNEEIGALLEAVLPDAGPERFLRVRCGTGRYFVLPVPREITTAYSANAWSYGLTARSFAPEVRT